MAEYGLGDRQHKKLMLQENLTGSNSSWNCMSINGIGQDDKKAYIEWSDKLRNNKKVQVIDAITPSKKYSQLMNEVGSMIQYSTG